MEGFYEDNNFYYKILFNYERRKKRMKISEC